ncbi:MAG: hypothetical protein ACE5E7_18280 [Anaerolineae bacterium]
METTHNYLFVSDFHLSEGRDPATGRYSRNEDFFHDEAFARFLAYHVNLSWRYDAAVHFRKPWKLIINGDLFDFLQVASLPQEGQELMAVCGRRSYQELSANERQYGLGTGAGETVWKLKRIAAGHPLFFQALAWFLAHDQYELVVLKGNHDIEISWWDVQQCFIQTLVAAYDGWYQTADNLALAECPLVYHEGLPPRLTEVAVRAAVHFPVASYGEKGLFYVEHGSQYDPANAFEDFEDPVLPDNPDLIELPSGSLFVRYLFNAVEDVHPFADNLKPLSRYFVWVLRHAPSALVMFLTRLVPRYIVSVAELEKKKAKDALRRMRGETRPARLDRAPPTEFERGVMEAQERLRQRLNLQAKGVTVGMLLSVAMVAAVVLLLLQAVRAYTSAQYGEMAGSVLTAVFFILAASWLSRQLDRLLESPYLLEAAEAVRGLLIQHPDHDLGQVPYFLFGHNHQADVREIGRDQAGHPHGSRQWYVNTGAWIPVFSEEQRLLREDVQLTFFRLVPGMPDFGHGMPELYQWSPEADRPLLVRLFSPDHQR